MTPAAVPQRPHVALTVEQLWQRTPGGSGTYIVELARELHDGGLATVTGVAARHPEPPPQDWTVGVPVRHARLPRRALYDAWQVLRRPRAESLVPDVDVVHATTWAVPPTRRPLVVTVHDLAFLHDAAHFTPRGNAFFRRALDVVRERADAVVVPSRSTADDCVAAGLDASRVTVVPHGARGARVGDDAVERFRATTGVRRDYVLWCGTIEPRKNLDRLLGAFAAAGTDDLDLVLVGPAGWGALPPLPAGLAPERVHVLGHLDVDLLAAAYRGARAFCFPSLREGFGLPVLEAMHQGTPVVTSQGTACAEVGGDAAVLVDPLDVASIADGLRTAVGDAHDDLAVASGLRAAEFSWEAAARATAEVYRSVL